ncbi:MAG: peptidyl-prolyl cis-trans isomerase [Deltaproteobacteria bacterium]|nr:peptidyl-prolyl cis-trans isomerase [Deltaproteobacteria bacterium]
MIQKSDIRSQKRRDKRLRNGIFFILFLIAAVAASPQDSSGFWPFTSKKQEPYIARVGDAVITTEEFLGEINKLHMSNRAGKAIAEQKSFAVPDYGKFLSELIDNKLMALEARNLGLDKEADFIMTMDNYTLNLCLEKLRQDEIVSKVKVEDKEIEDYYQEQLQKKEEEKKNPPEQTAKEKNDKGKSDDQKEAKKEDSSSEKKEEPKKMAPGDREAIRNGLFNIKSQAREKEYFAEVRKKAKVKIANEVLSALSSDKTEFFGKVVAEVNGEPVYGLDVVSELRASKTQDEEAKKKVLDKLILYKILDQEAMNRGCEQDEGVKEKIRKYREDQLIDQFKRKAILPAIKVDEREILEYYNANREKYMEPDKVKLRMIHVMNEDEARDIIDDLKKGGDFSYIARGQSIDPSKEKGGDIGWVQINQLSDAINNAIQGAKEGDILGPFQLQAGYAILEVRGIEKGVSIPLEKVKGEIDTMIGREKFKTASDEYIKRLRETVTIEINKKELDRIQGR